MSSSSIAPLALGIVGAAIGFFAGGGLVGASIGFSLGSMLGGALFPPTTEGPKLADLHLQGSSYGAGIPIIYGSARIAGNVIWQTKLTPHEHSSGGKGGAGTPQQKTTSYSASFDVELCESRGDHRLGKVWAAGRLVGNYRPGAATVGELPLVFYDGNVAQMPDATEEGVIGAGLVTAYRRIARTVLTDMDLSPYGNSIQGANLNFEILSGTIADCPVTSVRKDTSFDKDGHAWNTTFNGGDYPAIGAWPDTEGAPTTVQLTSVPFERASVFVGADYAYVIFQGAPYKITVDGVTTTYPVWIDIGKKLVTGYTGSTQGFALGWGESPFVNVYGVGCAGGVSLDVGQFDSTAGTRKSFMRGPGIVPASASGGTCIVPPLALSNLGETCGIVGDLYVIATVISADRTRLFVLTAPVQDTGGGGVIDTWWELINGTVARTGTVDPPLSRGQFGFAPWIQINYSPGYIAACAEDNGNYIWTYLGASTSGVRCYKIDASGNLAQICSTVQLSYTTPGFNQPSIHTAEGLCVVVAYDHYEVFQRYDHTATPTTTLAEIAADICTRDGMTAYDVSDIESIIVRGYILNSIPTTGRAALESILPAFFVDAVESDGTVKFVRRGKASLITIPDDDLAAHADGEALPDKLQVIRGQDEELPAHLILNYIDSDTDYLIGSQQWHRATGGSKVVQTSNLSVVLTAAEAKRIVETWGAIAWDERDQYVWTTTRKYIAYEPTDVVTVQGIDLRITNKTEGANGVIKWEGRRSRFGVFAQPGVGGAGGSTPGVIPAPQATDLLLLDIPYITDPTQQQKYFGAMAGADRQSWGGATLFKSIDDGATYDELISDSGPADTFGVTSSVLGDFTDGCVFDEANSVTVVITPGSFPLAGMSRAAVLNGQNQFLIGDEIVGAKYVSLIDTLTYQLSGLLRGLHGTEWATSTHLNGERFVALPVTVTIDALYAEYGAPRKYQTVTAGQALPAGSGAGGGGGTGFAATHVIDMGAWGHHLVYTKDHGGFGPNDLVVIKFTTGSGPSNTANMPRIAGAEYGGTGVDRIAVLSDTLGDFVGLLDPNNGQPYFEVVQQSSAPTIPFTVNNSNNQVYYPILAPNTTYYLNVKIAPNQPNVTGDSPMFFELTPYGTP